jgi:predicted RNA-binding protein with PIN domain
MNNNLFGIIYKSTISIPESSFYNKIYIGKFQCKSIEEFKNSKYKGSGKYILRILSKYGKDKVKTEVIYMMFDNDIQDKKEKHQQLGKWEKHFIKLYNSQNPEVGMNIAPGADGGDLRSGKKNSENHNKRISISNTGKRRTLDQKILMCIKHLGKKQTKETKVKRSNALKKHIVATTTREKIRIKHLGKKLTKETREKLSKANILKWENWKERGFKRKYKRICVKCNSTFICNSGRKLLCPLCKK